MKIEHYDIVISGANKSAEQLKYWLINGMVKQRRKLKMFEKIEALDGPAPKQRILRFKSKWDMLFAAVSLAELGIGEPDVS